MVQFLSESWPISPQWQLLFDHVGGPNKADFLLKGLSSDCGFEVTTDNPSTRATHLLRNYVEEERLISYPSLPADWSFFLGA